MLVGAVLALSISCAEQESTSAPSAEDRAAINEATLAEARTDGEATPTAQGMAGTQISTPASAVATDDQTAVPTNLPTPASASATAFGDPLPAPSPTAAPVTSAPPTPTATFPAFTRQTQFVPLFDPEFVPAAQRSGLSDDSYVLGLDWNGEQRAYPLSMVWWHHIVNDQLGDDPALVTY